MTVPNDKSVEVLRHLGAGVSKIRTTNHSGIKA